MECSFRPRMYKSHIPSLPISQIYGITTFELG